MSFNVLLETIVGASKPGSEKTGSISQIIVPFEDRSDANSFIRDIEVEEKNEYLLILRYATALY